MRHMPQYKDQIDMVTWHILSEHSEEMSRQSNVVWSHTEHNKIIITIKLFRFLSVSF